MKKYGLPYQGSKSRFAAGITDFLPAAPCLVDLFAGGCAVTHAALLSGKYRRVIDVVGYDAPQLFHDAANGRYRDETRWISRDDFIRLKDTDPYVRLCWSFGNNQAGYLYGREIEEWKHALHLARVFGDTSMLAEMGIQSDGSRADIMAHHEEYKRKYAKWWMSRHGHECARIDEMCASLRKNVKEESEKLRNYLLDALGKSGLTQAEIGKRLGNNMCGHYFGKSQWSFPTEDNYNRMREFMPLPVPYMELIGLSRLLQSLQSLQSLESLESLERLERLERLEIQRGDYTQCPRPVIISEYAMPPARFACVWERDTVTLYSARGANARRTERLFVPRKQLGAWKSLTGTLFLGDTF